MDKFKTNNKTAVILFQLGGPDSVNDVDQFLFNYFCDSAILDFPLASLFRKPLAAAISQMRSREIKHQYIVIGGKSPILELTRQQADALEAELRKEIDAKVFVAVRYSNPSIASIIDNLLLSNFDRFILLPLYPQYSKQTSGSCIDEWKRQCKKKRFTPPSEIIINSFYQHPFFIEALVEQINLTYKNFVNIQPKDINLFFSALSLSENTMLAGDTYKDQVEKTVSLIVQKGGWGSTHTLCYQGKIVSKKGLQPVLGETVKKFAGTGSRYFLVVPISFVVEQIETLFEIDIQVRQIATNLGAKQFEMMPALNTRPKFIATLKDIVMNAIKNS